MGDSARSSGTDSDVGAVTQSGDQKASPNDRASSFLERASERFLTAAIKAGRAAWVQNTFITDDTEAIAADASRDLSVAVMDLAAEAAQFKELALPDEIARQVELIKRAVELPVPSAHDAQVELTQTVAALQGMYGKGTYDGKNLGELERTMAESRDPDELLDVWRGWRAVSPPMRQPYARFVSLANEGARDLGFADLGAMWRSGYDMPADEFMLDMDRLWLQVKPLMECRQRHGAPSRSGRSRRPTTSRRCWPSSSMYMGTPSSLRVRCTEARQCPLGR